MSYGLAQDSDTKYAQREIKNMSTHLNIQGIAAIPTEYRGTLFRSRLEARWAVFFYSMGIEYQYEPRCFEKDFVNRIIRYLPDFYLPKLGCWAEVKGTQNNLNADWNSKMRDVLDYDPTPIYETIGTKKGFIILGSIPVYESDVSRAAMPFFTFIQHHEGLFVNKCSFFQRFGTSEIDLYVLYKEGISMGYYEYPILEHQWLLSYKLNEASEITSPKQSFDTARAWNFNKGNNQ